jgi:hypothetical protein
VAGHLPIEERNVRRIRALQGRPSLDTVPSTLDPKAGVFEGGAERQACGMLIVRHQHAMSHEP